MTQFAALRTMAERFYTDSITFRTRGTTPVFDPDAGTYTDTAGDEVYDGRCRIIAGGSRTTDVGEAVVPFGSYDVRLPWDVTGVQVGHVGTVDASTDPSLIGRQLVVTEVQGGSETAYRRVICEAVADVAPFDEEGS